MALGFCGCIRERLGRAGQFLWEVGRRKVLGEAFGQIIGQYLSMNLSWSAGRVGHSLVGNFGYG